MSALPETELAQLYPDLPPIRRFDLPVGDGHVMAVREWGSVLGQPVLLLHGGPGSGCSPVLWRFFDPRRYRVIAPDQRGAGASTPAGGVVDNDTHRLLADLRLLRQTLGLPRWLVAGGSWGGTLALAHALDMPEAVCALLLRAPFLSRRSDIEAYFAPDDPGSLAVWRVMLAAGQGAPGASLLERLHHQLHHGDGDAADRVARAWWAWERVRGGPVVAEPQPLPEPPDGEALQRQVARYRVQSHYLRACCWLETPPMTERVRALARMPVQILQGSADRVCPPAGALLLHETIPGSRLRWVPGVGHDPTHPAMVDAMVSVLDHYADHETFPPAIA